MKTAISIPDELFERAERAAARRGCTRSRLYADAIAALLAAEKPAVRVGGVWAGKVTIAEGTDIVGSDPDVLEMFED